jgi:tryptophan synthase alpha chain
MGLMGHVIADYPSKEAVRKMIAIMVEVGVEIIEIQIPFSEPVADGPIFLSANENALKAGVTTSHCMDLMAEVTKAYSATEFVFMTYINIPFILGYDTFIARSKKAGAKGVIIPDLPWEMSEAFDQHLSAAFYRVPLLTPFTDDSRMAKILEDARGFVYVVARQGVTGAVTTFDSSLNKLIKRIRKMTNLKIAVGFGVKSKADIEILKDQADYGVVGTKAYTVWISDGEKAYKDFWQGLKDTACR